MNLFEKILGTLRLDFLNRKNSPSQDNSVKMKHSSVGTLQQAGGNIYNVEQATRRPRIDLDRGFTVSGSSEGNMISFQAVNIGDESAVDIKWHITADDLQNELEPLNLIHKLTPSEKTHEINYYYHNTEVFKKELKSPKLIFIYKDTKGNVLKSGRWIKQSKRADGNFNIYSQPGDYFEAESKKAATHVSFEAPIIEVLQESSVSDFSRYNEVNIDIRKRSPEPLVILECTFDGVPTNHGSKKLDDKDVFHFDTIKKENIIDGYEPLFLLKVRKQTGEEFLFKSKLKIRLFGNRYDLMVLGDETIERL